MKKILFLILFLIPSISFASITFSPPSPTPVAPYGAYISCSVGDTFITYDEAGNLYSGFGNYPCDGSLFINSSLVGNNPYTWTVVECSSSLSTTGCADPTLTGEEADTGYIAQATLVLTSDGTLLFSLPSPQPLGTNITVTVATGAENPYGFSNGDYFQVYDPSGNFISRDAISGGTFFTNSTAETDSVVECLSTIPSATCSSDATLTNAEADSGFIHTFSFTFSTPTPPPTGTFLDNSVDTFFTNSGGLDFLGTLFAIPLIFAIVASMIRPFIF
jgi:hypothetical protein